MCEERNRETDFDVLRIVNDSERINIFWLFLDLKIERERLIDLIHINFYNCIVIESTYFVF